MDFTSPSLTPHFFEDVAALKHELTAEGEVVKARLSHAMQGLAERDLDLLDEVAIGDADVNARQIAIDDRAFKLLALYQPVAVDLRVIVAAIKIGDHATNIVEDVFFIVAGEDVRNHALGPSGLNGDA